MALQGDRPSEGKLYVASKNTINPIVRLGSGGVGYMTES